MTLPAMCVQLLRVQSSAADTIACRADGLCGAPLMYAQSPRVRSSAAATIACRAERSHDAPSMCAQSPRIRSSAADTIARRAERSHGAPRDARTVAADMVVRRGHHRMPRRTESWRSPRCAHNLRGYDRPPRIPSRAALNGVMALPAMRGQSPRIWSSAADTIACRADGLCGAPLMYAQSPRIWSSAACHRRAVRKRPSGDAVFQMALDRSGKTLQNSFYRN